MAGSEMHCYSTPCEAMPWAWFAVGIVIGIGIALIVMAYLNK